MEFSRNQFAYLLRPQGQTVRWGKSVAVGALAVSLLSPVAVAKPENGEQFNDWAIRCETPKGATEEVCAMFQAVSVRKDKDAEKSQRLLLFQVRYAKDQSQPNALMTVPLGVLLQAGLTFQVDDGKETKLPFSICMPGGCLAGVQLDEKAIWSLKAGKKATVTVINAARQKVPIPVSLRGFTAALNSLTE